VSIIIKDVAPFLASFFGFVALAVGADVVLHQFGFPWIGRYLGLAGAIVVATGLLPYSLRKRGVVARGDPALLLRLHEITGVAGAALILVHAGLHLNALLPWLAIAAMLVTVASGLAGVFLFGRARRRLESRTQSLLGRGSTPREIEAAVFWDALALSAMKKWRAEHAGIALIFAALASVHLLAVLMFWGWR